MALLTTNDIVSAFKNSFTEHVDDMQNTKTLTQSVVTASTFAIDRVKALRQSFNNQQSVSVTRNSSVFRKIFQSIHDKSDSEDDGQYLSSGSKEDNASQPETVEPAESADTRSRNKTSYEVANIQVQAVVAQTQILVENMSGIKTSVSNIDKNLGTIVQILNEGFGSLKKQNEQLAKQETENAKAAAMYDSKGYIVLSEYMKQIQGELKGIRSTAEPFIQMIKSGPKGWLKLGFDQMFESKAVKGLMTGIEESLSKGLTNSILKLGESSFLKANNPVSNLLRQILFPKDRSSVSVLELENGIKGSKPVPFDNVTHRTINDVIPGLLERILGAIDPKQKNVTYDMTTGKFTTRREVQKGFRSQFDSIRTGSGVNMKDGEVDFSELNEIIQPMVFYMASADLPIRNFLNMKQGDYIQAVLGGLGTTSLTKSQIRKVQIFWNYFHSDKAGQSMTQNQRRALQQINQMYTQYQQQINEMNQSVAKMASSGIYRSDNIGRYSDWNASDIANGHVFDSSKIRTQTIDGLKSQSLRNSANSSYRDIGTEFLHDIRDNITTFTDGFKKFLHSAVEQEGSIYVHDSVLMEYVKAIAESFVPSRRLHNARRAQRIHKLQHQNEEDRPDIEPEKSKKSTIDTSYANPEEAQANPYDSSSIKGAIKSKFVDPVLGRDKQSRKQTGWFEEQMYRSDMKKFESDIDYALSTGKISQLQAEELRQDMANSSPSDYKQTMLKTISQWSPAVIGGLAFGPFGALIGLGIRKYMKKTNADQVSDRLKKLTKEGSRQQKAQSKADKERERIQESIQDAYNEGRITYDQYQEALETASTIDPSEYQTGFMKWAKKLGPAVAAGLLGFGPLGVLVGLVAGKKLSQTTAQKLKKSLKKTKPVEDITDREKRTKLIQDINDKIDQLEAMLKSDVDQATKNEINNDIQALKEARAEITRAGKWSNSWNSLPGILKNIASTPKNIIRGLSQIIRKGGRLAKKKIGEWAHRGMNAIKKAINRKLFFYDDARIKTVEGRLEIKKEIENNPDLSDEQKMEALEDLRKSIEKYEKAYTSNALFRALSKGTSALGSIGGFITGSTQKKMASRGNRYVDEAKKLIGRTDYSPSEQATQETADNTQKLAETGEKILDQMKGNSVSSFDSGTHELLKQILFAIKENPDMSQFNAIEQKHNGDSPKTVLTSKVSVSPKKVGVRAKKKGLSGDESSDSTALALANITAANIDDPNDRTLRNEVTNTALDTADTPEAKQKIRRLFDKTYRNLKKKEDETSEGETSLLDSLFGNSSDGGSSMGSNLLRSGLNFLKKHAGSLLQWGIPLWMAKQTIQQVSNSRIENIDEHVISREDNITRSANRWYAGLGASADAMQAGTAFGSALRSAGRSFSSAALTALNKTKAGSKLVDFFDMIIGKLSSTKLGSFIDDFMFKNIDNKEMNNLLNRTLGGEGTRLNKAGKIAAAMGFILDVINSTVRQLSKIDPEFNNKMAAASGKGFISMLIAKFNIIKESLVNAEQTSGFSGTEILLKAGYSAAGSMALEKFIPIYGVIKAIIAIASIINDLIADTISDHNSSRYMMCIVRRNFCDDILELEQNILENASDMFIAPFAAIGSLFKGGFGGFKSKLETYAKNIIGNYANLGKNAVYTIVDAIILSILTSGGPILQFIIEKMGLVSIVTGLRANLAKLFNGEISFSEFWSETFGDSVAGKVASGAIAGGFSKLFTKKDAGDVGNGRGRGGSVVAGKGYNSDLYQESPMYKNAPYDMYESGCGPIALTAALRQQGIAANPMQTAQMMGGYRDADGGTSPMGILNIGNQMGGSFQEGSSDVSSIYKSASAGKPVVMMGRDGAFGDGTHYMTAVGAEGGNLLVRDPLSPTVRKIPQNQLGGVVTAVYGKGRGGGRFGRGSFTDAMGMLNGALNTVTASANSLFGGLMGVSGTSAGVTANDGSSGGILGNILSGFLGGIFGTKSNGPEAIKNAIANNPDLFAEDVVETGTATVIDPTGDTKSIDGTMIYPAEMRKDPTCLPRTGYQAYSSLLPGVKDLLLAQYKYTRVLPSVIACIMRGETEFGKRAHHKNLGNIKGSGKGTSAASNKIYDSVEGSNDNYCAYNFWGESIYHIGRLLCDRYSGVAGCLDTLTSLQLVQAGGYATADNYANIIYNYWNDADMATLKQYDLEAIKQFGSLAKGIASAKGRGRYGRGLFTDAMSTLSNALNVVTSGASSIFGGLMGAAPNVSMSDMEINNMVSDPTSGGTESAGNAGKKGSGSSSGGTNQTGQIVDPTSSLSRVWGYLLDNDPSAHISTKYLATEPYYSVDKPHTGVDIGATEGIPVYSPVAGTILKKETNMVNAQGSTGNKSMGNYVKLKAKDGTVHWFEHLQKGSVTSVGVNQTINEGDFIGRVGNTGNSYGSHLHYQVNKRETGYYDTLNPGAYTGHGRGMPNTMVPPVGMEHGGGSPSDYTEILEEIKLILQAIEAKTGLPTVSGSNTRSSPSRGSNRFASNLNSSPSIGVEYQRMIRGYP